LGPGSMREGGGEVSEEGGVVISERA
jgi:hypothetical protein